MADDQKKKPEFCTDEVPENAEDIASVERARLRGDTGLNINDPKELMLAVTEIQFEITCGLAGRVGDCVRRAEALGVKPREVCTFRKNVSLCRDLVDMIASHDLSRIDTVLSLVMVLDHLMAEQHSAGIRSASQRTGRDPIQIMLDLESKIGPMIDVVEAASGFVGIEHLVQVALVRWVKMASLAAKVKRDDEQGDVSADN